MRIIVNWGLCDGNGNCSVEAPTLFEIDENDTLHILKETVDLHERESAAAAVQACPKSALKLVD